MEPKVSQRSALASVEHVEPAAGSAGSMLHQALLGLALLFWDQAQGARKTSQRRPGAARKGAICILPTSPDWEHLFAAWWKRHGSCKFRAEILVLAIRTSRPFPGNGAAEMSAQRWTNNGQNHNTVCSRQKGELKQTTGHIPSFQLSWDSWDITTHCIILWIYMMGYDDIISFISIF